jgi:tetratricopeptide (TPR) repeat protein
VNALASALVFLAAYAVYLVTLAPSITLEDAGELVSCAAVLGNSHPPGHPWHILAGRLFMFLPVGCPAFRMNILSAICAALAALAAWRLALELAGKRPAGSESPAKPAFGASKAGQASASPTHLAVVTAGVVAATAYALARAPWWQATNAEKYSFAAALVAWAMVALVRFVRYGGASRLVTASFLAGLCLGVHFMGLYLVPLVAWAAGRAAVRARVAAFAVLMFLLPLGAKALYHPVRAAAHPVADWGSPDRLSRVVPYLAGRQYVDLYFFRDASLGGLTKLFLLHAVELPWREMSWPVLLAIIGIWVMRRRGRDPALAPVAGLFAVNVLFGVFYQNPEAERYFIPACFSLAVLAGVGAGYLVERVAPAAVLAVILLAAEATGSARFAARDRAYIAPDHVKNMLAVAPPGALVIALADNFLFPLLHAQTVDREPGAARAVTSNALVLGSLARLENEGVLGCRGEECAGYQEGTAFIRALARMNAPASVLLAPEQLPGCIPSGGIRWRGVLIEVMAPGGNGVRQAPTAPGVRKDRREPASRILRGLRLRSLLWARGVFEGGLVYHYALALNARGRELLDSGDPAGAVALARAGLRLMPNLAELHYLLGRAKFASGDNDAATRAFTSAVRLTNNTYADPVAGLAGIARAIGDREEEMEQWRTAAAIAVGAQNSFVMAGDRARVEGRNTEALREYRRGFASGLVSRGMVYFSGGRLPQAFDAWSSALELDPTQVSAMHNMGTLAASEERFADAAEWYRRALALAPGSRELKDNAEKVREAVAAEARLARLGRMKGEPDAGRLCDLGNAYWFLGRTRVAEVLYRRAIIREPGSERALGNLGSALAQQGRADEAIKVYQRALKANPDYVDAMVNLGAVYQGMGDRPKALLWVKRALEKSPGNSHAKRILADLTE